MCERTYRLGAALRAIESRFLTWTGAIDLLAMSYALAPEDFRRYIDFSREYRAVRKHNGSLDSRAP